MAVDKSIITNIPKQTVPASKKNDEWAKETIDAYIELTSFSKKTGERFWLKKLYDYYNGHINYEDYNHVLKPYGKSVKNVPADIRRFNIIKPLVDVLLGEKARRPVNHSVIVRNDDAVSLKEEIKADQITQLVVQNISTQAQQILGLEEGEEMPPMQSIQDAVQLFDKNYVDSRAILGQKALDYIQQYCETHRQFQKGFFHFLVSGYVCSYRGVNSNEPEYTILNPLDVDYDKAPDLDFIEDGDWVVVRRLMHPSNVIDAYWQELSQKEIEHLENPEYNREDFLTYSLDYTDDWDWDGDRERLIEVMEVYWKSRKKIGFVNYMDEFDEIQERIVDEKYKAQEGEAIEWHWVNEVWQGHRIDGRFYVRVGPLENQRGSIDNPSKCKLPINGRAYSDINSENISLVAMGIPYQLNYDIYKYRLELSIAKSKDIIGQFDINAIPKGWDIDKFMYFVDATGIAWVDYNKEGMSLNPQHQAVMDLSIRTIANYISLLESIRLEWEQASGITRQRQGNVDQYAGKGVTQQSIIQSSYITEDYFRKYSDFENRDLQALLDYSKDAWIDGKKTMYVMPDGTREFLDVDPTTHQEAEYGVFVTDSRKDAENLEYIKQLGQSMIQNGTPASIIAEMLETNNFSTLKHKIKAAEDARQQLEQAQKEADREILQAQVDAKNRELDMKDMLNMRDNETRLEQSMIQADAMMGAKELDVTSKESISDSQNRLKEKELQEEERNNRVKETLERIDLEIKRKQARDKNRSV